MAENARKIEKMLEVEEPGLKARKTGPVQQETGSARTGSVPLNPPPLLAFASSSSSSPASSSFFPRYPETLRPRKPRPPCPYPHPFSLYLVIFLSPPAQQPQVHHPAHRLFQNHLYPRFPKTPKPPTPSPPSTYTPFPHLHRHRPHQPPNRRSRGEGFEYKKGLKTPFLGLEGQHRLELVLGQ